MLKPPLSLGLALVLALAAGGCLSVDQRIIDGRDLGTAAPFYPGLHYLYGDAWFDECHVTASGREGHEPASEPVTLAGPPFYGASLLFFTLPEAVFDTLLLPCDGLVWLCCAEE